MLHTLNTKLMHEIHEAWARENGYRPEAPSDKPEDLHAENTNRFGKVQAPSLSYKLKSFLDKNPIN